MLKDIVYRRIKESIINGQFPMGSKLSETFLEQVLDANKAPIRDALKRLQAEGLVVRKPKSGTYVFSMESKSLNNLLDFRYTIESRACKLAFDKSQEQLYLELAGILDRMQFATENNNIQEYLTLDSEFHMTMVSLCDNRYYIDSFKLISAIMDTVRNFLGSNDSHLQRSFSQHSKMVDALKHKDINELLNILQGHILPEFGSYWMISNLQNKLHCP